MSVYEPNSRHLRQVLIFCFNMKAPNREGAMGKDRHKPGGASLRPEAPNEPGVERRTKGKPQLVLR
ncbi:hypothetical protein ALC57_02972 [Trachymyrmex cornetzi]|uniref:Uncharacterized protein n=1 Tax=Trachymyrmex cornetzi TaxID=471704 RepID=A0A151JMT2_9HYME|nr:hypothetical protein ALC57_02972 [Trachymyrmex cornetzi]